MRSIFWVGAFCILSKPLLAQTHLGYSQVFIKNADAILELNALVTLNPHEVLFEMIDEMGGTAFEVAFKEGALAFKTQHHSQTLKKSPLQRALKLPLTTEEFIRLLHFEAPTTFVITQTQDGVEWKKPNYKKMKILFKKFGTIDSKTWPMEIEIEYKKSLFRLKWIKIQKSFS